jgi:hypothetical protein
VFGQHNVHIWVILLRIVFHFPLKVCIHSQPLKLPGENPIIVIGKVKQKQKQKQRIFEQKYPSLIEKSELNRKENGRK